MIAPGAMSKLTHSDLRWRTSIRLAFGATRTKTVAMSNASGVLWGNTEFSNVIEFKDALLANPDRLARALGAHLLGFALGRKVSARDSITLDRIVKEAASDQYRIRALLKHVVLSDAFSGQATSDIQQESGQ